MMGSRDYVQQRRPFPPAATVPADQVMPLIWELKPYQERFRMPPKQYLTVAGLPVRIRHWPLRVFKHKGLNCVACGLTGQYFALQRQPMEGRTPPYYTLVLMAQDKDGNETEFTVDHILPVIEGGTTCLDNLQPMCLPCNMNKGRRDHWRRYQEKLQRERDSQSSQALEGQQ